MITITLPYPPSANTYWRVFQGRTRVSPEARAYKLNVARLGKVLKLTPISGPVVMRVDIYRPLKRGDLSNRIKVLEDALEGVCFEDDSQVVRIVANRFDDKANPRAVVTVESAIPPPARYL